MFDIDKILSEDSSKRTITLTTIVGKQGVGKTSYILRELISTFLKSKGVLIYDFSSEKKFRTIPVIALEDLHRWTSKGIYRIDDPDPVKVFREIKKSVRNCYLICEDARGYMKATLNDDIATVLGTRRQLGIDILCNFWALENVPTTVFTYSNYITIFKTRDKLEKLKTLDKIPNFEDVLRVWERVQRNPDPYSKLTISTNS
jgi:hypothetical protein